MSNSTMSDTTPTPQDRLTIDVAETSDEPRLVLTGEIDPHTAPMLQETIDATIGESGATRLTLDFASVTFVDSAGLRVIADTHRRLDEAGGALTVQSPSSGLQKLLTVTGLGDHVNIA